MDDVSVKRGLDGVVTDTSSISKVMVEKNALLYYGYPVQDLAENCSFEEVAYLLLNRELPDTQELNDFKEKEREQRPISSKLSSLIELFDPKAHPMDTLRTAVSFLATEDSELLMNDPVSNYQKSIRLLAQIPTIIASFYRHSKGQKIISPQNDLTMGENFFHMCFEKVPPPEMIKAFDVSLTLYAEHTFNASTFTARVIISSLSDVYSAVSGAIGSLRGPLHGGANEAVMKTMLEIADPSKAQGWIHQALGESRKIMGFGHRVYRNGDSRVPTMKKYMLKLSEVTGEKRWPAIYEILADTMLSSKGIYPNLDFPTGPAYYMMGFEIPLFTPIFVISRITGWMAHIMEQLDNNRLIRPLSEYVGPKERLVKLIGDR
ncbi:MAG: citrate synthase [bacterium]|nr:MAG: citrate synthase [bacterium]